jgi:hypothetical protein
MSDYKIQRLTYLKKEWHCLTARSRCACNIKRNVLQYQLLILNIAQCVDEIVFYGQSLTAELILYFQILFKKFGIKVNMVKAKDFDVFKKRVMKKLKRCIPKLWVIPS